MTTLKNPQHEAFAKRLREASAVAPVLYLLFCIIFPSRLPQLAKDVFR